MVKQSFTLDPNAQDYTDDEIVAKVNAASSNITRVNAVGSLAVDLSGKDADDLAESVTKKWAGVTGADFKKSIDTLEEITEGSTKKHFTATEKTKLTGVEEGADVNVGEEYTTGEQTKLTGIEVDATADQTGAEIRDSIVSLDDLTRRIILTEPIPGQFRIIGIQRAADGKLEVNYDDVPVTA